MATSFRDIQGAQKLRSAVLLVALGILYFLSLTAIVASVRLVAYWMTGDGLTALRPGIARQPEPITSVGTILWQSAGFGLLLGSFLVAVQYWFARNNAVEAITDELDARSPDTDDLYHRRFRNLVEEMSIAAGIGGRVRPVVTPTLVMSAFAAEDRRSGAILGVTEGLLSRMGRNEFMAIVAHELTHVREGDAFINAFTCALMTPYVRLLELLLKAGGFLSDDRRNVDSQESLPSVLLRAIVFMMNLVSASLSRQRELLADAGAVELTRNPLALARALHAVSRQNHFMGGMAAAWSPIFVVDPVRETNGEGLLNGLFSSHPPVSRRLQLLLQMAHAGPEALEEARVQADAPDDDHVDDERKAALAAVEAAGLLAGPGLRLLQPQAAASDAPRAAMSCPRCAAPLVGLEYEGVSVRACAKCGGILVDERRLPRILARRERRFSRTFREQVRAECHGKRLRTGEGLQQYDKGDAEPCACPACTAPMLRQYFSYAILLVVDRCHACHLVWFDHRELDTLQLLVEEGGAGTARPTE